MNYWLLGTLVAIALAVIVGMIVEWFRINFWR